MSSAQHEAAKRIDQLNLVPIGHRLRTKENWPLDRIAQAEREYRRFLLLVLLHPHQMIVPWSEDLDTFWHYHILDSRKYEEDCREVLGRFIHHDPNVTTLQPTKYLADRATTQDLYAVYFNPQKGKNSIGRTEQVQGGVDGFWWTPCGGGASVFPSTGHDPAPDGSGCAASDGGSVGCGGASCGGGGCGGGCGSL